MKSFLLAAGLLVVGIGAGWLLSTTQSDGSDRGTHRSGTNEIESLKVERVQDLKRIRELEAEIERLKALLAARPADADASPWPNDTPEAVERLINEAYAENNIDWLLEAIERLLRMGEPGYPLLRKLIMDLVFKAKFIPTTSDFQPGHFYRFARIFANQERGVIGFLNFLLSDGGTLPIVKQFAMMGAAFYAGSNAPGTEQLKQTLMQLFMEQQGAAMPGMLPGDAGTRMKVFAMAMSGDPRMIPALRDELNKSKDKGVQGDIIGALAYLGDPQALPLIQERLDPTDGNHYRELSALGRIGTDEAHETASQFLRSIPDSKRFYSHATRYVREGGGTAAVLLMKERIEKNPKDPEVNNVIGTLRRYPTQESLETLNFIAATAGDKEIQERAQGAAEDVDRRLKGELPDFTNPNAFGGGPRRRG